MGLKGLRVIDVVYHAVEIKSDQNGIESAGSTTSYTFYLNDKIRPEWDWKGQYAAIYVAKDDGIKSDQNGIESVRSGFLRAESVKTFRIKSDQNGIESVFCPECLSKRFLR